jgi:hypothetical protein
VAHIQDLAGAGKSELRVTLTPVCTGLGRRSVAAGIQASLGLLGRKRSCFNKHNTAHALGPGNAHALPIIPRKAPVSAAAAALAHPRSQSAHPEDQLVRVHTGRLGRRRVNLDRVGVGRRRLRQARASRGRRERQQARRH